MTSGPDPFAETRMSLGEHLEELRGRLFKGVLAVFLAFALAWVWRDAVVTVVTSPYDDAMEMLEEQLIAEAEEIVADDPERERTEFFLTADPEDDRLRDFKKQMIATAPGEAFFFQLKLCLYAAFFLGAPILLWQLWGFVGAGLYRHERRVVMRFFPVSVVLFVVGVGFGFRWVVPYAMYFLNQDVSIEQIIPDIKVQDYLTFLSSLCLAFGIVFQLPVLMSILGLSGAVQPGDMARYRGHFLVGAFVLAAVLTPPDPFTQALLGLPMVVLYEIGIWSARLFARRAAKRGAAAPGGTP